MKMGPVGTLRDLLLRRADLDGGGTQITVGDTGSIPFIVPAPYKLVINPGIFGNAETITHLRHGIELAWMRGVAPNRPAVCGILAARVAMLHHVIAGGQKAQTLMAEELAAETPNVRALTGIWRELARHQNTDGELTSIDVETIESIWTLAAPSEFLMTAGGNPRLEIEPFTGVNYYGCGPRPLPDVITFSSCTASPISERGYSSAEACRRRILGGALIAPRALDVEYSRLSTDLLDYFGVTDIADVILAPSGTDATMLATSLIHPAHLKTSLTAIIMGLSETGTAIPDAATHHNPLNLSIDHDTDCGIRLRSIALRDGLGIPRPAAAVEADVLEAVVRGTARGQVILHAVDLSKTGLLAPRAGFVTQLAQNYHDHIRVVMDCCQGRARPSQIQRYLCDGHTVIVTGSKFYTGPPFSGAVLFPRGKFGLAAQTPDPGTLLRWAAALSEMRAYAAVAPTEQTAILQRFGDRVRYRIATNPRLVAFHSPAPRRPDADGWDEQQTIFVFAVRDPSAPHRFLDFDTLTRLQRWLYSDLSEQIPEAVAARVCRLGQPVRLGENGVNATAALRIAAGARLVSGEPSHVLRRGESHIDREVSDLDDVFTKLDLILDRLPILMRNDSV